MAYIAPKDFALRIPTLIEKLMPGPCRATSSSPG